MKLVASPRRVLARPSDGATGLPVPHPSPIVAASLSAARERLAIGDSSLVILDVGLPDGSGLDLLPQINAAEPPIPVLVFSAYELDSDARDQVSAACVKSRTDEGSLVRAIRASLEESSAVTIEADPAVANGRILEKEGSN